MTTSVTLTVSFEEADPGGPAVSAHRRCIDITTTARDAATGFDLFNEGKPLGNVHRFSFACLPHSSSDSRSRNSSLIFWPPTRMGMYIVECTHATSKLSMTLEGDLLLTLRVGRASGNMGLGFDMFLPGTSRGVGVSTAGYRLDGEAQIWDRSLCPGFN
jgi:hypothetical protein